MCANMAQSCDGGKKFSLTSGRCTEQNMTCSHNTTLGFGDFDYYKISSYMVYTTSGPKRILIDQSNQRFRLEPGDVFGVRFPHSGPTAALKTSSSGSTLFYSSSMVNDTNSTTLRGNRFPLTTESPSQMSYTPAIAFFYSVDSESKLEHVYQNIGHANVTTSIGNSITRVNDTKSICLQEDIKGLQSYFPEVFPFGEAVNVTGGISQGSNVTFYWDFGDKNNATSLIPWVTHVFNHTVGLKTVSIIAGNDIRMEAVSCTVLVRERILGLQFKDTTLLSIENGTTAEIAWILLNGSHVDFTLNINHQYLDGFIVSKNMTNVKAPAATFFCKYNTTLTQPGWYRIEITASNRLDSVTLVGNLSVQRVVHGVTMDSPKILKTNQTFNFTIPPHQGDEVRYLLNTMDGNIINTTERLIPLVYTKAGRYDAYLIASNDISSVAVKCGQITVQDVIEGLQFISFNHTVAVQAQAEINWILTQGSELEILVNYGDGSSTFVNWSLSVGDVFVAISKHNYSKPGEYLVTINVTNLVDSEEINTTVYVETPGNGVILAIGRYNLITAGNDSCDGTLYVRVNDSVTATATVENGTNIYGYMDFGGNSSVRVRYFHREFPGEGWTERYSYSLAGEYNITITFSNRNPGDVNQFCRVIVQNPINVVMVTSDSPKKRTERNLTFTVSFPGSLQPSGPLHYRWRYGDDTAQELVKDNRTKIHSYPDTCGIYIATVNVSNKISFGLGQAEVVVQDEVKDLKCFANYTKILKTNQTFNFTIPPHQGDEVRYLLNTMDGNIINTTERLIPFVYTKAGRYDAYLIASNDISSVAVKCGQIIVQDVIEGLQFISFNHTVAVQAQAEINWILTQGSELEILVNYGDGSSTFVNRSLSVGDVFVAISKHNYSKPGEYLVTINVTNLVDSEEINTTVYVETPGNGVILAIGRYNLITAGNDSCKGELYVRVNDSVTATATVENGTNIYGYMDFGGNSSVRVRYFHREFPGEGWTERYSYSLAGEYNITITFSNRNPGDVNQFCKVIVQNPINVVMVTSDSPKKRTERDLTFTVSFPGSLQPSGPLRYLWRYGDGKELVWDKRTKIHSYPNRCGVYIATVNVSNEISFGLGQAEVVVQDEVKDLKWSANYTKLNVDYSGECSNFVRQNDTFPFDYAVAFSASANGTNVSYTWSFPEDVKNTNSSCTHKFKNKGENKIVLTAENAVSSETKIILLKLVEDIWNVSFVNDGPSTQNSQVNFTLSMTRKGEGSFFHIDFKDSSIKKKIFKSPKSTYRLDGQDAGEVGENQTFGVTYKNVGKYPVSLHARNNVSCVYQVSEVAVQDVIEGLQFISFNHTVAVQAQAEINWILTQGSELEILVNYGDGSSTFVNWSLSVGDVFVAISKHNYSKPGEYLVTINVTNLVDSEEINTTVYVETPGNGVILAIGRYNLITAGNDSCDGTLYVRVNDSVTATATVENGTNIYGYMDFGGNSSVRVRYFHREFPGEGWTERYSYSLAGEYNITITFSNRNPGDVNQFCRVIVQNPINVVMVTSDSPKKRTERNLTFTVSFPGSLQPSGPLHYRWRYGDDTAQELVKDNRTKIHSYPDTCGIYIATVNVSNKISFGLGQAEVVVQDEVKDLKCFANYTKILKTNQTFNFTIPPHQGDEVRYLLNTMDGNIINTTERLIPFVYTKAGRYDAYLIASNDISSVAVKCGQIIVQDVIEGLQFISFNHTVAVQAQAEINWILTQGSELEILVNYGDGSSTFVNRSLSVGDVFVAISKHNYSKPGEYLVTINVTNLVDSEEINTTVYVETPGNGVILAIGRYNLITAGNDSCKGELYVRVNDSVTATATVENGTNIYGYMDFGGNSSVRVRYFHREFPGEGWTERYSYSLAGEYNITITFSNRNPGDVNQFCKVIVQNPINVVMVTSDSPKKRTERDLTFTVSFPGSLQPSGPLRYLWRYGDGKELVWDKRTKIHSYPNRCGVYIATVNVSNEISFGLGQAEVVVQDEVKDLKWSANYTKLNVDYSGECSNFVRQNDTFPFDYAVAFSASANGTNVSYTWSFPEDVKNTNSSCTHKFKNKGENKIVLTAENAVSSETKIILLKLVEDIWNVSFVNDGPSTQNSQVNFTLSMTRKGEGSFFHIDFKDSSIKKKIFKSPKSTYRLDGQDAGEVGENQTFGVTYKNVGKYPVSLHARNNVSCVYQVSEVAVQDVIEGLQFISFNHTVAVQAQAEINWILTQGSELEILVNYGDGSATFVNRSLSVGDVFVAISKHNYSKPGEYLVTITVTNLVDSKEINTYRVIVQSPINVVMVTSDSPKKRTERNLTFTVSFPGSLQPSGPLHYQWRYGDDTDQELVKDNRTKIHSYPDRCGVYIATVNVSNEISFGLGRAEVVVQDEVKDLKWSANYTKLNVDYSGECSNFVRQNDTFPFDYAVAFRASANGTNVSYTWSFPEDVKNTNSSCTHKFKNKGENKIVLTAENAVSSETKIILLKLVEDIWNVSFVNDGPSTQNSQVNFTLSMTRKGEGSFFHIDFKDSSIKKKIFKSPKSTYRLDGQDAGEVGENQTFGVTYKNVGKYPVSLHARNNVSCVYQVSEVAVQDVIEGLQFISFNHTVAVHAQAEINWILTQGSELEILVNYGDGSSTFVNRSLSVGDVFVAISKHNYSKPAEYLVTINVTNLVDSEEINTTVYVETPGNGVILAIGRYNLSTAGNDSCKGELYVRVNDSVTATATVENGTNIYGYMDFGGNSSVRVRYFHREFPGEGWTERYSYSLAGEYNITITFSNRNPGDVNQFCKVIVQNPINVVMVTSDSPKKRTERDLTFTVSFPGSLQPSGPLRYLWRYGDGKELVWDKRTKIHSYPNRCGVYIATVNVSNEISFGLGQAEVVVQDEVKDLKWSANYTKLNVDYSGECSNFVRQNDTFPFDYAVAFSASANGTNVSYTWSFPEDVKNTNSSCTHKFKNKGENKIVFTAENAVSSETKIILLKLVEDIWNVSFVNDGPSTQNSQVNFTLSMTRKGEGSFFHIDFKDSSIKKKIFKSPKSTYRLDGQDAGEVGENQTFGVTYKNVGKYPVSLHARNNVSCVYQVSEVVVARGFCTYPVISVPGFEEAEPRKFKRSEKISIKTDTKLNCFNYSTTLRWEIDQKCDGQRPIPVIELLKSKGIDVDRSELLIPARFFNYCSEVEARFTVNMTEAPGVSKVKTIKFEITKSPLRPIISGGSERTVGSNHLVEIDAENSHDPDRTTDKLMDQDLKFAWFCHRANETYSLPANLTKLPPVPTAKPATNGTENDSKDLGGCFGFGPGRLNFTSWNITLNTSKMIPGDSYVIIFAMNKEGREMQNTTQHIDVKPGDPPILTIK